MPGGAAVAEGLTPLVGEGEAVGTRGEGLTASDAEQTKAKTTPTSWAEEREIRVIIRLR